MTDRQITSISMRNLCLFSQPSEGKPINRLINCRTVRHYTKFPWLRCRHNKHSPKLCCAIIKQLISYKNFFVSFCQFFDYWTGPIGRGAAPIHFSRCVKDCLTNYNFTHCSHKPHFRKKRYRICFESLSNWIMDEISFDGKTSKISEIITRKKSFFFAAS